MTLPGDGAPTPRVGPDGCPTTPTRLTGPRGPASAPQHLAASDRRKVPPSTLVYPVVAPTTAGQRPTGRVELAPGFPPPQFGPAQQVPPTGFRPPAAEPDGLDPNRPVRNGLVPTAPKPRPPWTVIWIGIAAGVLATALVLAFVFQPRPRDAASDLPPAPTTDLPASTGPPTAGATTGGNPTGSEPEPSTDGSAPSTGSGPPTSSPALGSGVPADPGWPPSRIPTSLIPHSPTPDAADPAGGVVAARHRVAGFVAALNDDDPDAAD